MITFNFTSITNSAFEDLVEDVKFVYESNENGKYHFRHSHNGRAITEINIEVANGDLFVNVK